MTLTQNHFELFALPPAFDIDQAQLAERYRELQRSLHPDRFANASDQERRVSVQKAAQVNEAFQTLKAPLARARYMLQLNGVEFDDEKETHFDGAFLMQQMELREELAEVRGATDPLQKLATLMAHITKLQNELQDQLREKLQDMSENNKDAAKQIVQKMQFFLRLQQQAEELEEDLVDSL